LPIIDLSRLGPEANRQTARRLGEEETQRLFDLSTGPLLRVGLLRLSREEHVALLTMHHIVSDGWSMGVLTGEVGRLYGAYVQGLPSPLQELNVQYADFAHWQRKWLLKDALERQLAYWRKTLEGAPPLLKLPTDRTTPAVPSYRGASRGLRLSESLSQALRELSRREGVTLFMTLLAAFKTLLYYYTGRADIVVGAPIANRIRTEIEPLIGLFVNMLALRAKLSGHLSFRSLLNQTREICLGAYANQDLPFEQLVQELRPERELGRHPLFQVVFALQNAPMKTLEAPGLTFSPFNAGLAWSPFDLFLQAIDRRSSLGLSLWYNTALFTNATIELILEAYETLLQNAVSQPEARIDALLDALAEADRQRKIREDKELRGASVRKLKSSRREYVTVKLPESN
jgi:hypothetical protein